MPRMTESSKRCFKMTQENDTAKICLMLLAAENASKERRENRRFKTSNHVLRLTKRAQDKSIALLRERIEKIEADNKHLCELNHTASLKIMELSKK